MYIYEGKGFKRDNCAPRTTTIHHDHRRTPDEELTVFMALADNSGVRRQRSMRDDETIQRVQSILYVSRVT